MKNKSVLFGCALLLGVPSAHAELQLPEVNDGVVVTKTKINCNEKYSTRFIPLDAGPDFETKIHHGVNISSSIRTTYKDIHEGVEYRSSEYKNFINKEKTRYTAGKVLATFKSYQEGDLTVEETESKAIIRHGATDGSVQSPALRKTYYNLKSYYRVSGSERTLVAFYRDGKLQEHCEAKETLIQVNPKKQILVFTQSRPCSRTLDEGSVLETLSYDRQCTYEIID